MDLNFKKQINKAFWTLRLTIGFVFIINGLQGLLTWYSLSSSEIASTFPQNFYNLGISGLTYAIIISSIELLLGILFFTPFLQVAAVSTIIWLLIKHSQSTYLLITLLPKLSASAKLFGEQIMGYYSKTMTRIMLLAAILAFKWIAQARTQLKD